MKHMKHLLQIEWLKLRTYRTFWVLFIFCLLGLFAINFLAYGYYRQYIGGSADAVLLSAPFGFPNVWQSVSYVSGLLLFLPGLLIMNLMSNEMNFRTHRQNIIDGISRTRFIHTKLVMVILFSFFLTIVVFLCGLLLGLVSGGSPSFRNIQYIGYFFLQCVSYGGLSLLFGLWFKKLGLAIGMFFLYLWVVEKVVSTTLNLFGKPWLGNYLPLSTTDKLTPFPFASTIAARLTEVRVVPLLLLMTALYLFLYARIAIRKFSKDDL